jgi:hypothetical protein
MIATGIAVSLLAERKHKYLPRRRCEHPTSFHSASQSSHLFLSKSSNSSPAGRISFTPSNNPPSHQITYHLSPTFPPKHQQPPPTPNSATMRFSLPTVFITLIALSSAAITDVENVYATPRSVLDTRQAANGACCIPQKSLKQDACTVNGAAGKCVPGGPAACKTLRSGRR